MSLPTVVNRYIAARLYLSMQERNSYSENQAVCLHYVTNVAELDITSRWPRQVTRWSIRQHVGLGVNDFAQTRIIPINWLLSRF